MSQINEFKSDFSSLDETGGDRITERITEYFEKLRICTDVFNLSIFKKFLVKNIILDEIPEEDMNISEVKRLKLFESIKNEGDIFGTSEKDGDESEEDLY
mmetsp:Transcript_7214/g.6401  ORF Transcript_7214/g.6401 Transcript_7214/m.6401 type:complete len:100 (+) Transcript_7214:468-767(+)